MKATGGPPLAHDDNSGPNEPGNDPGRAGPLGVTNIRTFTDPQNPTRVAVLMDVADMDAVMDAMQTQAMADAMAYDGVLPESLVILVEE